MTYIRAEIEQCPAFGWQGGPSFKTLIVTMASGRERRNAEWAQARHSYSMPFLNISPESYRNIKQMHYVCRGMVNAFQFQDQLDYQADNDFFGVGDGVKTEFQLGKVSVIEGVSYDREIYLVRPGATFTDNGSTVTPTVDEDRGLVTFSSAPADGNLLRWSGEFLLWVRFNQDDLPFSLDNLRAVNGTVSLIEVPPPGEDE